MSLGWWERYWPDADRLDEDGRSSRPEDEPAEPELADEEADRVERNATRHW